MAPWGVDSTQRHKNELTTFPTAMLRVPHQGCLGVVSSKIAGCTAYGQPFGNLGAHRLILYANLKTDLLSFSHLILQSKENSAFFLSVFVSYVRIYAQGWMVSTGSSGENPGRRRCFTPLFEIFECNLC